MRRVQRSTNKPHSNSGPAEAIPVDGFLPLEDVAALTDLQERVELLVAANAGNAGNLSAATRCRAGNLCKKVEDLELIWMGIKKDVVRAMVSAGDRQQHASDVFKVCQGLLQHKAWLKNAAQGAAASSRQARRNRDKAGHASSPATTRPASPVSSAWGQSLMAL
jgi:hypothetical protein